MRKNLVSSDNKIEKIRARKDAKFRVFYQEAIQKAIKLVEGSKNEDYNSGGVKITDYFNCIGDPVKAAFCPCWRKTLREKSLISSGHSPNNESLLDNIVDHINYLAFLYAITKLTKPTP